MRKMIFALTLAGLLTLATAVPAFAAHNNAGSSAFHVEPSTNDNPSPSGAGSEGDGGLNRGTQGGAVESQAADGAGGGNHPFDAPR